MATAATQAIQASAERVFECIANPDLRKRWQAGLEETVYLSQPQGGNPVGTRFVARIREGGRIAEYEGELTAYAKPEYLAFSLRNSALAMVTAYRIARSTGAPAGACTVEVALEVQPRSLLARLMLPLGRLLLGRIVRTQLLALKALAEGPG